MTKCQPDPPDDPALLREEPWPDYLERWYSTPVQMSAPLLAVKRRAQYPNPCT